MAASEHADDHVVEESLQVNSDGSASPQSVKSDTTSLVSGRCPVHRLSSSDAVPSLRRQYTARDLSDSELQVEFDCHSPTAQSKEHPSRISVRCWSSGEAPHLVRSTISPSSRRHWVERVRLAFSEQELLHALQSPMSHSFPQAAKLSPNRSVSGLLLVSHWPLSTTSLLRLRHFTSRVSVVSVLQLPSGASQLCGNQR